MACVSPAVFRHDAREASGRGHAHAQAFADDSVEVLEVLRIIG